MTHWYINRFDLWEEVNSSSFFTTAVQHRALREGATFANRIGQTSVVSGYTTQADNLLCFLQVSRPFRLVCVSDPCSPRAICDSRTGTRLRAMSLRTPAAVAPARMRTRSSRLSTPSTLLRDVTPRRSSLARTRRCRTSRSTLMRSGRSTPSTAVSPPTPPFPPVGTLRTATRAAT